MFENKQTSLLAPIFMFRFTKRRLLVLLLTMVLISISPIHFWRLVFSSHLHMRDNWMHMIKSTTIYHFLSPYKDLMQLRKDYFDMDVYKSADTEMEEQYRRLVRGIIHIHRVSNSDSFLPSLLRTPRNPSESEKSEALQSLKAALPLQSAGHHTKARKLLEHAFLLDPDNPNILIALGEAIEGSLRESQQIPEQDLSSKSLAIVSGHLKLRSQSDCFILAAEHMYTKALIVNPNLGKATENRRRLRPIVDEIDQRLFNLIDFKVSKFYHIPETNPGFRRAKLEHYFKHIYHSNAIEGNTLTLAQTRSILETRLAIGGKSLLEHNEVLGLDAALRFINNTLLRSNPSTITLNHILELHRHILGFVDLREAGQLRRTQVFIADHTPPPAESIPHLMDDLIEWFNSNEASEMHPVELAALTHWKLVFIHPFYDGNGRTARLLMNLILMRAGIPPAIIRVEDRSAYYELIKTANDGDVRPFIRFIVFGVGQFFSSWIRMHSLKGSVEGLQRQLRAIKFHHHVNFQGMISGHPSAFVEFYRQLLCNFNVKLTSYLVERGFGTTGTTDYRFMEIVYRILRDILSLKPTINLTQFFTNNFSERKLQMATMIVQRLGSLIDESEKNKSNITTNHRRHKTTNPTRSSTKLKSPRSLIPSQLPGVYLFDSAKRMGDQSNHNVTTTMNSNHEQLPSVGNHVRENGYHHANDVVDDDDDPLELNRSYNHLDLTSQSNSNSWARPNADGSGRYGSLPDGCEEPKASGANIRQCTPSRHSPKNRCRSWTPSRSNSALRINSEAKRGTIPSSSFNGTRSNNARHHSAGLNRVRTPAVRAVSSGRVISAPGHPPPQHPRSAADRRGCKGDLASSNHCFSIHQKPCGDQETLDNILSSLSQLTSKVDSILSRMNYLESRLTSVELTRPSSIAEISDERLPAKYDKPLPTAPSRSKTLKNRQSVDSTTPSADKKSLTNPSPTKPTPGFSKSKPHREPDSLANHFPDRLNMADEPSSGDKLHRCGLENPKSDDKSSVPMVPRSVFVSKLFEHVTDDAQNSEMYYPGPTDGRHPNLQKNSSPPTTTLPNRPSNKTTDPLDSSTTSWRRYPPGLRTMPTQMRMPLDDTTPNHKDWTSSSLSGRRLSSADRLMSLESKVNDLLTNRKPSPRSLSPPLRSTDRKLLNLVGDENSYRDQVQRITTMLTETQTLLDDRSCSNFPFKPDDLINVMNW